MERLLQRRVETFLLVMLALAFSLILLELWAILLAVSRLVSNVVATVV